MVFCHHFLGSIACRSRPCRSIVRIHQADARRGSDSGFSAQVATGKYLNTDIHSDLHRNAFGEEMSTLLWLLIYDVLFAVSAAVAIFSAKSMMKQFEEAKQDVISVKKLLSTIFILAASCFLVLYASGVMTVASTR
jgi:heme/copper-type cytochrome/quinol oxidase subunit 3